MELSKQTLFKIIIGGVALIMCLLFFVVPLLIDLVEQMGGEHSGYTAFNFATGSNGAQSFPVAFLLLIAPVALAILAFIKQSFKILCGVSAICLILQIVFVIATSSMRASGEALTGANWMILTIYVGLCILTLVGIRSESAK